MGNSPRTIFSQLSQQLSQHYFIIDLFWTMRGREQKFLHCPNGKMPYINLLLIKSFSNGFHILLHSYRELATLNTDKSLWFLLQGITLVHKNHFGSLVEGLNAKWHFSFLGSSSQLTSSRISSEAVNPNHTNTVTVEKSQVPTCFARPAIVFQLHTSGTGTAVEGVPRRQQAQMGATTVVFFTWSVNFKKQSRFILIFLEPHKLCFFREEEITDPKWLA